ncbi:MAG: hypothetical protein AB8U25_01830 [Rickettsiales endosymbiont of Dermacentor nuttalli]
MWDADITFSETSLIQTIGRAACN